MEKISFLPPKAIIGVLHIDANPGTFFTHRLIEQISEKLQEEAALLEKNHFDALLVANPPSGIASRGASSPEIVSGMTAIVLAVKKVVKCPVGVQFLGGSSRETLAIAVVTGAQFIRVRSFDTISGAAPLMNYRNNMDAHSVAVIAEILASPNVDETSVINAAEGALSFGANGIILSDASPKVSVDSELLRKFHSTHQYPIWVGSGVGSENLMGLWPFADAFIIDDFLRKGPLEPIDKDRLNRLTVTLDHLKHSIA